MASLFSGDDFKLESLDFLGDEAELRARAEQELNSAQGLQTGPLEGADASGAVRVAVDREGWVSDVDISRDWRERAQPAEFASALYSAYSAAVVKQLNAVALEAFADKDRGRGAGQEQVRPPVDNADERVWLSSVWSILSDNDDKLHRIERGEQEAEQERSVTGPHGYLTARFEGRTVTGISGNAELIKSADHEKLRVEALAVFRAARSGESGEGN